MIVIDVETTGLEPSIHALISVGALDFENPENQFYEECRVWEGAHIDLRALEINGFKESEIIGEEKQSVESLVEKFQSWVDGVKDKTLVGENPSMDRDFMRASYQKSKANWNFAYRTIDLHSVCYAHMVQRGIKPPSEKGHTGLNLDGILEYVGLSRASGAHHALTDTKLEAEALSRLFYSKSLLEEFSKNKIPKGI